MNYQQPVHSRSEAERELTLIALMHLVLPVAVAGLLAAMGLFSGDVATLFLLDAPIIAIVYVVATTIGCALKEPAETRLCTRTLTAYAFSFLPKVIQLLKTLKSDTLAQPILATPGIFRLAIPVQLSIPSPRFQGVSPQQE